MSQEFLMGLDVGGSGGRCLLVDVESGRAIVTSRPWSHRPAPETGGLGWDLDLEMLWQRLGEAAREVCARAGAAPPQVLAVAATSLRFGLVALDAEGVPLLALPNRDARAAGEALRMAREYGGEMQARAGHWPQPIMAAPRLRWMAGNRPDAWSRLASVLGLSDWVTHRLCGELSAEPSQAGETLLFDLAEGEWAWDWVDALEIPRRILPPLHPPGHRLGGLTAEAAAHLGLREGTPVAVGGADSQCGLLGAGAVAPGQLGAVTGTTAPMQVVLRRPVVEPEAQLWSGCHVVPGLYVLEGNAGPVGEVLEWFGRLLAPDSPSPAVSVLWEASHSEPGALGMLSTLGADAMTGRDLQIPVGNLTLSHLSVPNDPAPRRHLARAIVEGMAFALRANRRRIEEATGESYDALHLAGGMSRSASWAQLLADVLDIAVKVAATPEASALGAAICAGVAIGAFDDAASGARALGGTSRAYRPDPERAGRYHDLYESWSHLRATRREADALAAQLTLPIVLGAASGAPGARRSALRPRILVTADLDEATLEELRRLGELEYASFRERMRLLTGPSLLEALEGVQVFVTEVDLVDADALAKLPALRVIAACRGDAVNVDLPACTAHGVPVLHAPGRNAEAVADLTLAFLLMLARKLPEAADFLRRPDVRAGDMGRMGQAFRELQGRELWQKTVGLVGLGAVGRAVARRLCGFGARLRVFDPHVPGEEIISVGALPASLPELLEESDFVSLHAAVTEISRGLIDAEALARMKPGAFLVNTARAALVDEAALADALAGGHLGGAALDVFSLEPPGADHPLLSLPNVIATPHLGGNTVDVAAHQGRIITEDLERMLSGERPQQVRNPETLDAFDWERPRPRPGAEVLAELAKRPPPAVSDIQKQTRSARAAAAEPPPPRHSPVAGRSEIPGAVRAAMERILEGFVQGIVRDDALRKFATDRDVALHFTLTDLELEFWFRMRGGVLEGALGRPDASAEVELRMRADILDGMFTGRVNPMQEAMSGRLSFTGDAAKAMTLQHLQADLERLYTAARERAGDPGDLASLPDPSSPAALPPSKPGDPREQLVEVANQLYAQQLLTATGGNVSIRSGDDEVWITPSQLFKGDLRPEILVRIGIDGRMLDSRAPSPSSERAMHCAVYRSRPEAGAVVHAHAPHATILANTDLPFLPISTEAAFFGNIPRIPFIMPGTDELAEAVASAIREEWAVLLKNHGLLVAGRSLRRAADMVEIIERAAEIILGCRAAGKDPPTLPEEVVATLREMGDLIA